MSAQAKPLTSIFVWLTVFGLLLSAAPAKGLPKAGQDTPLSELSAHELAGSLIALDGRAPQASSSLKLVKSWPLTGSLGSGFRLDPRPAALRQLVCSLRPLAYVQRLCVVGMIELRI